MREKWSRNDVEVAMYPLELGNGVFFGERVCHPLIDQRRRYCTMCWTDSRGAGDWVGLKAKSGHNIADDAPISVRTRRVPTRARALAQGWSHSRMNHRGKRSKSSPSQEYPGLQLGRDHGCEQRSGPTALLQRFERAAVQPSGDFTGAQVRGNTPRRARRYRGRGRRYGRQRPGK